MIVYTELWETMKKRGITKYALTQKHNISKPTIKRLKDNRPISSETVNKLCTILNCEVSDVMKFIPDNKQK